MFCLYIFLNIFLFYSLSVKILFRILMLNPRHGDLVDFNNICSMVIH